MMRNILFLSALTLTLLLGLAACGQKDGGPRIGVVDTEKVFQNSKLAQKGMAYIEGVSKEFNERLDKMQAAANAEPENQELAAQLQSELMRLQGDFEARQVETGNSINKLFEDVLGEYREKNSLDVILPSQMVLSSGAGVDVTDAVISLLDTKSISFSAMGSPLGKGMTPPPDAAPSDAAPAPGGAADTK